VGKNQVENTQAPLSVDPGARGERGSIGGRQPPKVEKPRIPQRAGSAITWQEIDFFSRSILGWVGTPPSMEVPAPHDASESLGPGFDWVAAVVACNEPWPMKKDQNDPRDCKKNPNFNLRIC
jgi:hypothetical protein